VKTIREFDQLINESRSVTEIRDPTIHLLQQQSGKTNLWKIQPVDQFRRPIPAFKQTVNLAPVLQLADAVRVIGDFQVVSQASIVDRERMVHKAAPIRT